MQRTNQPNMFYGAKPELFARAKYLRENMTESEQLLWHKLRNNQLKYRFKAQHPINIFIADFYCHQKQLVIEIDGKIHEKQTEYDAGRTAELNRWGITVLRFSNEDVMFRIDDVIQEIERYLNS